MWNKVGVCALLLNLLVASTSARPSKEGYTLPVTLDVESLAKLYATMYPNTELERNPEYGEYFEGDIRGRENSEIHHERNPLNAVTNPDLLWPNGTMYYKILKNVYTSDQILKIKKGISDLVERTKVNGKYCIQIIPWKKEPDYVEVVKDKGCWSDILGRKRGGQQISLADACVTSHGTIMHEFLHAYGFGHEHSRHDRDNWVSINWCNIEPGKNYAFEKQTPPEFKLLTPYDYESVMHYHAYALAIDTNIPTITPLKPNVKIGQRDKLSDCDIERVQILYGCIAPTKSRICKHLDPK